MPDVPHVLWSSVSLVFSKKSTFLDLSITVVITTVVPTIINNPKKKDKGGEAAKAIVSLLEN